MSIRNPSTSLLDDPDVATRTLVEIANTAETVMDSRIERINRAVSRGSLGAFLSCRLSGVFRTCRGEKRRWDGPNSTVAASLIAA